MPILLRCDQCDTDIQLPPPKENQWHLPPHWDVDHERGRVLCQICLTGLRATIASAEIQGPPRVRLKQFIVDVFRQIRIYLHEPQTFDSIVPALRRLMPDNKWAQELTPEHLERMVRDWLARGEVQWVDGEDTSRLQAVCELHQERA